jgi:hypothetical protein
MTYLVGLVVVALILVGVAILKRPYVKASLNFRSVGFFIEARNETEERKAQLSLDSAPRVARP